MPEVSTQAPDPLNCVEMSGQITKIDDLRVRQRHRDSRGVLKRAIFGRHALKLPAYAPMGERVRATLFVCKRPRVYWMLSAVILLSWCQTRRRHTRRL